ncbi:MarR family transcriptional regulator [Pseudonocardiaceae bacterium YIM PH 21723]|nr:MarR family transcriptional regulator [Pseudonocardiaceae bacterium YIM PH 21723]
MVRGRDETSFDAVDLFVEQWRQNRPDLDVSHLQVLGRLHRCFARYQRLIGDLLEEFDLSVAAFDVLTALRRSGAPYKRTVGELARYTLVTTGGITLRVDKLEQVGLVARERDSADGRIVHVALTDKGRELVDKVVDAHAENGQQLLADLAQSERTELSRLLARLESSLVRAENQP